MPVPVQTPPAEPQTTSKGPETPAKPTPRRARAATRMVWHGVTVFSGLLLGISLLLLAHKFFAARLFPAPQIQINYALITTPNPRLVQAVYVPAIQAARTQILVMAHEVTSLMLLKALRAKAQNGVDVEILLDPGEVNDATVRWAQANGLNRVFVDVQPMDDQVILIDGSNVIQSSLPFTADAGATIHSIGLAVDDPGLGRKISQEFFQRVSQLHPVQQ